MAIPEVTSTLRTDGEWRAKYRDLCREFDATQAQAGELRTLLLKLLGRFANGPAAQAERIATVSAELRDDAVPLNLALLRQVIEQCARESSESDVAWTGWQLLLDRLSIPPAQAFALKHLRERGPAHCAQAPWVEQLAALVNDCLGAAETPVGAATSMPIRDLAPLFDCLVIPAEFEARAAQLREELASGHSAAPVHEMGRFLNDLYAFLRKDLRNLGEYLKTATAHLGSVEGDLNAALQDSQEAAHASERLTTTLATEVAAIDSAINGEMSVADLKKTIDARVQSMRTSMATYVERQRDKQVVYEQRISELAARVRGFEAESEALRQEMLAEQVKAYRDTLTQLPNRLAYDERSILELARARRSRAALTLAVLDLDHFKRINDELGHKVGDKVLRHAADLCRRRMRTTDLLARFGGEEFVALFPDTALAPATNLCEELRRQIELASFQYHGRRVPVTVSIGLTEARSDDSVETLVERAGGALYDAKRNGRKRVTAV